MFCLRMSLLAMLLGVLPLFSLHSFAEEMKEGAEAVVEDISIFPSFKEVVTLGFVSDDDDKDEQAARDKYESIFVTGELDRRGFIAKIFNFLSMGLFFNPETHEAYNARLLALEEAKKNYVSDDLDERSLLEKGMYWVTKHDSVDKETYEERETRLEIEAIARQERLADPRTDFERGVDLWSDGAWAPGIEQTIPAHEKALGSTVPLRAIVYGQSTYQDVLNVLGTPVHSVRMPNGRIEASFVKRAETYKRVPWIGDAREVVDMSFDEKGVLEDPSTEGVY